MLVAHTRVASVRWPIDKPKRRGHREIGAVGNDATALRKPCECIPEFRRIKKQGEAVAIPGQGQQASAAAAAHLARALIAGFSIAHPCPARSHPSDQIPSSACCEAAWTTILRGIANDARERRKC